MAPLLNPSYDPIVCSKYNIIDCYWHTSLLVALEVHFWGPLEETLRVSKLSPPPGMHILELFLKKN